MDAARSFANGGSELQPLNPAWDHRFLDILDSGQLDELDKWSNSFIAQEGGNSAHEIRTWVAAFSALASAGPYQTAAALLQAGSRSDRRLRRQNGGADDMTPRRRRTGHRFRGRRHDGGSGRPRFWSGDAGRRKVQPLRRFHRAVGGRHLGTGSAGATPGRLRAAAGRRCRLHASDHRGVGQRLRASGSTSTRHRK